MIFIVVIDFTHSEARPAKAAVPESAGVGAQAARYIFDQFRGKWEVGQMPLNLPAQAFWRRTIAEYTQGRFVEHELHDERWDGFLQCFDNSIAGNTV